MLGSLFCSTQIIMASIPVVQKKRGRGRPATGQDPVTAIRLSPNLRKSVDDWHRKAADLPSRSEAIRRLVELGLTVPTVRKSKRGDAAARAVRHTDAERAAHDYIDNALKNEHEDVRAARKKRLTTMPGGTKRR